MEPLIVRNDQSRVYQLRCGEARILVDGERSGGAWWLGHFREDPGFMTPLHAHPQMDEQMFVLEGVLSLYVLGQWHSLERGTLAVVPKGVPHAQANRGERAVILLGAGHPAGFERIFPLQHEMVGRIPVEDPRFAIELSQRLQECGTEVLGPTPL